MLLPPACFPQQQVLPSPPKTALLQFLSAASSTCETARPAYHVPGKTRLCSCHSALVQKLNRATSRALPLAALSSLKFVASLCVKQDAVHLALTLHRHEWLGNPYVFISRPSVSASCCGRRCRPERQLRLRSRSAHYRGNCEQKFHILDDVQRLRYYVFALEPGRKSRRSSAELPLRAREDLLAPGASGRTHAEYDRSEAARHARDA